MIVKVSIKSFNFIRILLCKLPPAMNRQDLQRFVFWSSWGPREGKTDAPSRNLQEGREAFRL